MRSNEILSLCALPSSVKIIFRPDSLWSLHSKMRTLCFSSVFKGNKNNEGLLLYVRIWGRYIKVKVYFTFFLTSIGHFYQTSSNWELYNKTRGDTVSACGFAHPSCVWSQSSSRISVLTSASSLCLPCYISLTHVFPQRYTSSNSPTSICFVRKKKSKSRRKTINYKFVYHITNYKNSSLK